MEKRILDRGNLRDVIVVLSLASAIFFPINLVQMTVGLVILAGGTVLHVITKATLVRNKVLCEEGVYRICRHPYYLSNFIVDVSLCLLSGNMYLVLLYPFLFFWAYGPTLKFEEEKLSGIHGQRYFDFLLKSPQIFPCQGSLVGLRTIFSETSATRITKKEWTRITRFWAMAFLLLVAHDVAVSGIHILYIKPVDIRAVVFAALAIVLLIIELILQLLPKKEISVLSSPSQHKNA
ncbi:MAG: isoprenylcysteine carboxylmethyltransferase family protein [Phycisphaerae bacterium]